MEIRETEQRFGFGETLADAIAQVQRLRRSHDALLVALRWCAAHDGECLSDHPEVLAKVREAMAQAEGVR